jgi:hypothetical protein
MDFLSWARAILLLLVMADLDGCQNIRELQE